MNEKTLKFYLDPEKKLDKLFEKVKRKNFPLLEWVKILYVFRTKPRNDDEGMVVIGETKKLGTRDRDLYGYDFEISIFSKYWGGANKHERKRLAWHELNHCGIQMKHKIDEPMYDNAKRIKIFIHKHDLVLRTFIEEIEKFGPTKSEKKSIENILKMSKKERRITRR